MYMEAHHLCGERQKRTRICKSLETRLSWNGKRVQRESRKHCKRRKTPGEKQERQEKREHRATRSSKADVARATRASRLQAEWIALCPCSAAARPSPGAWSWERFARLFPCQLASKSLRKWCQNASRRLQNRAKMAPRGLPEATPRAELHMVTFFAPFFRLLGGSWRALGALLAPLGFVLAALGPLLRSPGALLGSILGSRGPLFPRFWASVQGSLAKSRKP